MRTRKKRKKRNEEEQDLQKVQKRENRETIKNTHQQRRKQRWKKKRRKKTNKKWYIRKIMKKNFGWTSVGQVARYVEHCLWPPTCSSWQFACCGFQRAQLLSQFIWIRWTHVLLLSCLFFYPAFLGACSLKLVNVWKSVVCRGNKIVLVCLLRCMIFFCLHVTRVVSRLNHPAGSIFCAFFVVEALCFSFELNLRPYFAAHGFLVGLRGTCNAGVFFRSCWWHLAVSACNTFESSASRFVLLCHVLSHFPRPVCFFCTAFAGSCLVKDGVLLGDRDGFSLLWVRRVGIPGVASIVMDSGLFFFFRRCCLLDALSYLPMWSGLLSCGTFFGSWHCSLHWRGTMALHALKLDGVSASARHVWRDLMVSVVYLYFCWPLLRFEVASVPGRFLHGIKKKEEKKNEIKNKRERRKMS